MPITSEQRQYYISVVHELNRAIFFKDCPNYVDKMDTEIARLEADDSAYGNIPAAQINNFSKTKPFGRRKGSAKREDTVTTRTGAGKRRKNRDN